MRVLPTPAILLEEYIVIKNSIVHLDREEYTLQVERFDAYHPTKVVRS